MREIVQSEIQARAEQKVPSYKEGQQRYAKQYRVSVHRWSYGRLSQCIHESAAKVGIAIEIGQQPIRGSPEEKARDLAIAAYHTRIATLS
jgi:single-stranded DNA-specific DHH superfamily exonuclease